MTTGAFSEAGADGVEADRKSREALQDLVDRLHLSGVRVQRLSAETMVDGPFAVDVIVVNTAAPEVLIEPSRLAVRFTQQVCLQDKEKNDLARVDVSMVVDHRLDAGGDLSAETVQLYVDHNAYFIAYPYLREVVQNATARLGLNPIVLGILKRGDSRPSEVTVVTTSAVPIEQ